MNSVIRWNEEKNQLLQIQRGVSFELVLEKLEANDILDRRSHPNVDKYAKQEIFVLELNGYVCYVPFIEEGNEIFLKTIIPNRKLNKEFKGKGSES